MLGDVSRDLFGRAGIERDEAFGASSSAMHSKVGRSVLDRPRGPNIRTLSRISPKAVYRIVLIPFNTTQVVPWLERAQVCRAKCYIIPWTLLSKLLKLT